MTWRTRSSRQPYARRRLGAAVPFQSASDGVWALGRWRKPNLIILFITKLSKPRPAARSAVRMQSSFTVIANAHL